MCFLIHNYSKVETDGFQYCKNCGKARRPALQIAPHPCSNGHIWQDTGESTYVVTRFNYGEMNDYYIPQKCKVCGDRRSVSQY